MLDLSLFRERTFAAGNVVLVLAGFGLFGVFFFLSLYLQGVLGLSAVQGGLAFTPMAAVLIVAAPLSAKLAERFGAARVVASGWLLFAARPVPDLSGRRGARITSTSCPGLLVAALGSALTTPLTTAVLAVVPVEKAGVASGALNTSRELAGALGIAVMGAILAARENDALARRGSRIGRLRQRLRARARNRSSGSPRPARSSLWLRCGPGAIVSRWRRSSPRGESEVVRGSARQPAPVPDHRRSRRTFAPVPNHSRAARN